MKLNGMNLQDILQSLVIFYCLYLINLYLGMVNKDDNFIDAIKDYKLSETLKDEEKHDTEIENMFYFDKIKHLLVMERDSKRFKVWNSQTGKFLKVHPESNKDKGGAIIAADYIELKWQNNQNSMKMVATTSNRP